MAIENMHSAKARVYIGVGNNPQTGRMIVKNTLFGKLKDVATATADKVLAVAEKLTPCLEGTFVRLERVVSSTIEHD